ncbi:6-phospho-beta-glucosidase [Actinopolymorpha singaporensis]
MKLAILGGGGFRVPLVYKALLNDTGSPRVTEVALYDRSAQRLEVMKSVLAQLAAGHADAPRVHATEVLDEAVEGADFIFSAIRVGGLEGRTKDERVALDLGVLGQETTGPGGIAYGLRTIPVMLHIAERVRALAPKAFFINFTNPAGMITEALQRVLGDRVIGICDTPGGLGRRIARSIGLDSSRIQVDYVGLNHLGWIRRLVSDGEDHLPRFLADEHAIAGLEEGEIFGPSWIQAMGVVPNEYLYYYYFNRDAVRSIVAQPSTRGEFLVAQQGEFYAAAGNDPDHALDLWKRTIAHRKALYMAEAKGKRAADEEPEPLDFEEEAGYEGVALAVMAAIARNEKSTIILNVRNGATLPGLPADATVEVPSLVDANGAHPLATTSPDLHQLGLMQQVKAVDRLVIEAATTGSADAALKAFALHPLVDSVTVARDLLRGYVDALPGVAEVLHR